MESSVPFDWAHSKFAEPTEMGYFLPSDVLADLAPSDYRLIPSLKCDLGGQHFTTEEDLQSMVAEFFIKQDTEWYSAGIHKLISRYNKCLAEHDDYVEK